MKKKGEKKMKKLIRTDEELEKIYKRFKRRIKRMSIKKATELLNQEEENYYFPENEKGIK